MPLLCGLPNSDGDLFGEIASSRTNAMQLIKHHKAVTAAGSFGAINIWRANDGTIQAEFQRHFHSLSFGVFRTYTGLDLWLREWWPRIEQST